MAHEDLGFIPDNPHEDLGFIPDAPLVDKATTFSQGLTTNKPTSGFGAAVGRMAPAAIGGAVGAFAGPVGAGAGGAAGEATRQALASYYDPQSPGKVIKDVGVAGAEQLGGEVGMRGLGLLKKPAQRAGAQILEAFPRIAEKYGSAVLKKSSILWDALSQSEAGQAFNAFEEKYGLKSLKNIIQSRNRASMPSSELEEMVVGTANKITAGKPVTPQELYQASQAGHHLKLAARVGDPQAAQALASGIIKEGSRTVDEAAKTAFPEYGKLTQDYFESKAAGAFKSFLPLNKNQTPNKLALAVV